MTQLAACLFFHPGAQRVGVLLPQHGEGRRVSDGVSEGSRVATRLCNGLEQPWGCLRADKELEVRVPPTEALQKHPQPQPVCNSITLQECIICVSGVTDLCAQQYYCQAEIGVLQGAV